MACADFHEKGRNDEIVREALCQICSNGLSHLVVAVIHQGEVYGYNESGPLVADGTSRRPHRPKRMPGVNGICDMLSKLKVEGGTLSISGERKAEKEEKDKKYHRVERSYGAFSRSFTLPEGALAEKISAEFKDGVLMVHLPKDEKAKPRAIEVKVS